MANRWEFVPTQTNRGSDSDAAARRFVRGTAMRAFRQRQRLERAQQLMHRDNQAAGSHNCEKVIRRTCTKADCGPADPDLPDRLVEKMHSSAGIPSKSTFTIQDAPSFFALYESGDRKRSLESFTIKSGSYYAGNLELSKFNQFEAGGIAIHSSYVPLFKHCTNRGSLSSIVSYVPFPKKITSIHHNSLPFYLKSNSQHI